MKRIQPEVIDPGDGVILVFRVGSDGRGAASVGFILR